MTLYVICNFVVLQEFVPFGINVAFSKKVARLILASVLLCLTCFSPGTPTTFYILKTCMCGKLGTLNCPLAWVCECTVLALRLVQEEPFLLLKTTGISSNNQNKGHDWRTIGHWQMLVILCFGCDWPVKHAKPAAGFYVWPIHLKDFLSFLLFSSHHSSSQLDFSHFQKCLKLNRNYAAFLLKLYSNWFAVIVKWHATGRMGLFSSLKLSLDQNGALQGLGHQLRNTELLLGTTTQAHPELGSDNQLLEPVSIELVSEFILQLDKKRKRRGGSYLK